MVAVGDQVDVVVVVVVVEVEAAEEVLDGWGGLIDVDAVDITMLAFGLCFTRLTGCVVLEAKYGSLSQDGLD